MTAPFDPAVAWPPDAEAALTGPGLSLARLYDLSIAGDTALRERIERASGHGFQDLSGMAEPIPYDCDATAILDRLFLWHQPAWPAVLTGYDLLVEWCDRGGARFAHVPPPERGGLLDRLRDFNPMADALLREIRGTAGLVRARYDAIIGQLRDGTLEAFGHRPGVGEAARISVALWSTPSTRIDFGENEVRRLLTASVSSPECGAAIRREITEPLWSGVIVRRPAVVTGGMPAERQRSKGGNPGHIPWTIAFDRMLVDILRDQDYPESAAAMARLVEDGFAAINFESPDLKDIKKNIKRLFPLFYDKCIERPD